MKILLVENLDWRLQRDLPDHEVKSVPLIGWAGLKNEALLSRAEKEFDILLTMDSNMVHQQNLPNYRIAVIALKAKSNWLTDMKLFLPKVLAALSTAKRGTWTVVEELTADKKQSCWFYKNLAATDGSLGLLPDHAR